MLALDLFDGLVPDWPVQVWAWAVQQPENGRRREVSRDPIRRATWQRKRVEARVPADLTPAQRREACWRRKRGATTHEIAMKVDATVPAVRAYLVTRGLL